MSVHKDSKRNTWYVKYNNKTKRGFSSKKDAIQFEASWILEDSQRTIVQSSKVVVISPDREEPSYRKVAMDYLRYKKDKLSFGSYDRCRNAIEKHVFNMFDADKSIDEITKMDCRLFYERLGNTSLATHYKNSILIEFKGVFKHAREFFDLTNNPAEFLQPFKYTFEENVERKEREKNIWTEEEFSRFIVQVQDLRYKTLFIALFFTGLRIGEALALTWKDFDGKALSISKSATKTTETASYEIKEPKSASSYRRVELGQSLSKLISEFKAEEKKLNGFKEDWFVFGRTKPLSRTSIDREKDRAISSSGIKRIRIHDFRHSHASCLIANGMNIVAVSKRLGHSDVNMTLKVYTHLLQKTEDELIDFLEKSSHNLLTETNKAQSGVRTKRK